MAQSDPTKKLSKTKLRIVETAVAAFNEQSFGAITTAALAERLAMSEGNLWYHYKTKADLLAAIQGQFLEDWDVTFSGPLITGDIVADYVRFTSSWTAIVDRYRFVFRDRSEYGAHSPVFENALPTVYNSISADLKELYTFMMDAGDLHLEPVDLDDLVLTAIIASRFYLEFMQEAGRGKEAKTADIAVHHLTLLKPLMAGDLYTALKAAFEKIAQL